MDHPTKKYELANPRLAQATSAMVRLIITRKNPHIKFSIKYNLYRSLVLSILTYGCESWTLNFTTTKMIHEFENKAHSRILGIYYYKL